MTDSFTGAACTPSSRSKPILIVNQRRVVLQKYIIAKSHDAQTINGEEVVSIGSLQKNMRKSCPDPTKDCPATDCNFQPARYPRGNVIVRSHRVSLVAHR